MILNTSLKKPKPDPTIKKPDPDPTLKKTRIRNSGNPTCRSGNHTAS